MACNSRRDLEARHRVVVRKVAVHEGDALAPDLISRHLVLRGASETFEKGRISFGLLGNAATSQGALRCNKIGTAEQFRNEFIVTVRNAELRRTLRYLPVGRNFPPLVLAGLGNLYH